MRSFILIEYKSVPTLRVIRRPVQTLNLTFSTFASFKKELMLSIEFNFFVVRIYSEWSLFLSIDLDSLFSLFR